MANHLPLTGLRAFEAAARHLSFTKAAEELNVTPAAISQQVKTLENVLGVRLFHRLSRALVLTPAGEAGLPKLREGFFSLAEGVHEIRGQVRSRPLNVWVAPSFATKWLVPRLHRFAAAHPHVDLRINASAELIDAERPQDAQSHTSFRQHGVDVAVRFGTGKYSGCRADRLLSTSVAPLCHPRLLSESEHPLRTPHDLRFHTLLHDETLYEGRHDWASWLQAAGTKGIDVDRGLHFNHVLMALDAAADGQGVALSLLCLAEADVSANRLVVPFEPHLPIDSAYYVVSPEESATDDKVLAFREWLLLEALEARCFDVPAESQGA